MTGPMRCAVFTLLALCASLALGGEARAQVTTPPAQTGPTTPADAGALRALAERLARESTLGPSDVNLFAGTIPALPVAFVPPPSAQVIGATLERPRAGGIAAAPRFTRYRVFLTVPNTAQEIVDAIVAGFARSGYARTPTVFGNAPGGFASASPITANLCRAAGDPRILVRARSTGSASDVVVEETVSVLGGAREVGGPCDPERRIDPQAGLPAIRSARAVSIVTRANAATPDASSQTADVFTGLGARTLVEGWAAQAVADGWALRSVTSSEETAVATLARDLDGHPRLLLIAVARVRPGQYYASLTNAATPAEPNAVPAGR